MMAWIPIGNGQYRPGPSAKGKEALARFEEALQKTGGTPLPLLRVGIPANDNIKSEIAA